MSILDTLNRYHRRLAPGRYMQAGRIALVNMVGHEVELVIEVANEGGVIIEPREFTCIRRPAVNLLAHVGDWFVSADGREYVLSAGEFEAIAARAYTRDDYDDIGDAYRYFHFGKINRPKTAPPGFEGEGPWVFRDGV